MKPLKVLLTGHRGQVGSAINILKPKHWDLHLAVNEQGDRIDLSDLEQTKTLIRKCAPQVIINAAAFTEVDLAEKEPSKARVLNKELPNLIAIQAKKLGAFVVHYSTDYVFDGESSLPWKENDATSPLNVYGQTKLEGETSVLSQNLKSLIFRTSWVYGLTGKNFLTKITQLLQDREILNVVNDQVGTPTSSFFLAEATIEAVEQVIKDPNKCGLYHLTAKGSTSWYDFAVKIQKLYLEFDLLIMKAKAILPCTSEFLVKGAKRPHFSVLNCSLFDQTFGIIRNSWEIDLQRLFEQMTEQENSKS